MKKRRTITNRIAAIIVTMAVAFTMMPAAAGALDADAATAYWKSFKAAAASESRINLSWKALTKAQQKKISGIAIYRNGKLIKRVAKTSKSFASTGLSAGKTYKYQLKTYKTYTKKVRVYYNKKTGKWQAKKIKGARTKKVKKTTYKYSNASPSVSATTKSSTASIAAPANVKAEFTGIKDGTSKGYVKVSWDKVSGAEYYWVHSSFGDPVDSDACSKTFTLDLGETYTFQITAVKNWTEGPKSEKVSITLPAEEEEPEPEKETVEITDFEGTVRTVEVGDEKISSPVYNREVDGIFTWSSRSSSGTPYEPTGDTSTREEYYIQKDGKTFFFGHYTGNYTVDFKPAGAWYTEEDTEKTTLEIDRDIYSCTKWIDNLEDHCAPTAQEAWYIDGDHGRRMAEVTQSAGRISFDDTHLDAGTVTVYAKYGEGVLNTYSFKIDNLGTAGSSGLCPDGDEDYEIAKTAVAYFEAGNGCSRLNQESYQALKGNSYPQGKYYAEMRAIIAYIWDNYEYEHMSCWGCYSVLMVYSALEYGEYGCCLRPYCDPEGTNEYAGHVAFRPNFYCEQGTYNVWFDGNGHK